VCGGQHKVGNECDIVSRMWGRFVRGSAGMGQECGKVGWKCVKSVRGSGGSGAIL